MRKVLLAIPLLLAAAACSKEANKKRENALMQNDFESLYGWGPISPSLTEEKAHSGKYSLKINKELEYSLAYITPIGKLLTNKPSKLRLTGWVYLSEPNADAQLTLQIMDPANGSNVFNEAIPLREAAGKTGNWVEVSKVFTLPEVLVPTHELRVYLWRGGSTGEPVFVDDLELSVEP